MREFLADLRWVIRHQRFNLIGIAVSFAVMVLSTDVKVIAFSLGGVMGFCFLMFATALLLAWKVSRE